LITISPNLLQMCGLTALGEVWMEARLMKRLPAPCSKPDANILLFYERTKKYGG
jgi:hypothetical protein